MEGRVTHDVAGVEEGSHEELMYTLGVEAHIIIMTDANAIVGDFYNDTLQLALTGFLREEQKVPPRPCPRCSRSSSEGRIHF